ncbi:MAG: hypothetical protein IJQ65_00530 [Kiritimatiellae bacterium]|nr:hypothetical protein [Kiritimatiellia bacterium]
MNTNVKLVMLALLAVHCGRTYALNYYLKPAATDWNDTESYALGSVDGGKPSTTPGSSDVVYLPANKTCSFTAGTDSFNVFANVDSVVPNTAGGDSIEITVGSGTNDLNCAITGCDFTDTNYDSYGRCMVTKKGAGALALKSTRKTTVNDNHLWDYHCSFTVDAGDVIVQQTVPSPNVYLGSVTLKAGARLFLGPTIDTQYYFNGLTLLGGLHGAGLVTNDHSSAAVIKAFRYGADGALEDVPFSGRIDGAVHVSGMSIDLTGTNSTYTGTSYATYTSANISDDYRFMKVRKFGKVGEPSSIGSGSSVGTALYGGRLIYTGDVDDECDKNFYFNVTYGTSISLMNTFDAGGHGGLRFTGTWTGRTTYSGSKNFVAGLVLTGSNTVPCVIAAPINRWRSASGNPWQTFHIKKQGTGTWELSGNAKNSTNAGAVTVEEGTLRYDSLAEVGELCSLGTATNLHEFATGDMSDVPAIPFAIVLGGSNTTGRLEYVGTERIINKTRLIGLAGAGVIASAYTNVEFSGVCSYGEGSRTLVLDGSRQYGEDFLHCVTNGEGVVSVVKTGSGTWSLGGVGGELSFSGELAVSNGTLNVIAPDAPFNWFRMTLKDCSTANVFPRLYELALYDANGKRQNIGLKCNRNIVMYSEPLSRNRWSVMTDEPDELEAGYFMYAKKGSKGYWDAGSNYTLDRDAVALFSDTGSTSGTYGQGWNWSTRLSDSSTLQPPTLGNEESWLPITMHLTNGTPEIAAYDLVGYTPAGTNAILHWSFEGSIDGRTWEMLTNVDYTADHDYTKLQSSTWYSTQKGGTIPGRTLAEGEGFPLRGRRTPLAGEVSPLANVSGVYVAPGATLKARGTVVLPAVTLGTAGMGTLDGFSFAASGRLNVVDVPAGNHRPIELPFSFENAVGVDNIVNWRVYVNGRERRGWRVERRGDKFVLWPRGSVLIFR